MQKTLIPQRNDSIEDPGSIFVGGFSCSTTHFHIKKFFLQFGEIKKINMAKNKRGGSKGYCFVIFEDRASAQLALQFENPELRGRKLSCRPIMTGNQLEKAKKNIDQRRITVANFPISHNEAKLDSLRKVFFNFGKIENIYFAKEVEGSDKKELTLFITYSTIESAKKALDSSVIIEGNILKIDKYIRIIREIPGQLAVPAPAPQGHNPIHDHGYSHNHIDDQGQNSEQKVKKKSKQKNRKKKRKQKLANALGINEEGYDQDLNLQPNANQTGTNKEGYKIQPPRQNVQRNSKTTTPFLSDSLVLVYQVWSKLNKLDLIKIVSQNVNHNGEEIRFNLPCKTLRRKKRKRIKKMINKLNGKKKRRKKNKKRASKNVEWEVKGN